MAKACQESNARNPRSNGFPCQAATATTSNKFTERNSPLSLFLGERAGVRAGIPLISASITYLIINKPVFTKQWSMGFFGEGTDAQSGQRLWRDCPSPFPSPQPSPLGRGSRISNHASLAESLSLLPRHMTFLPLPKGPQNAKRSSPVGKLIGGGLGKPLGRGEGERDNHQPATRKISKTIKLREAPPQSRKISRMISFEP